MPLCCVSFYPLQSAFASPNEASTWYHAAGVLVCVLSAATAAGLTLGMLSLDPMDVQLKLRAGTASEKSYAEKVRKQHYA